MGEKKKILIAVLLLSLFLRIVNLNQSLWLDEAIGAIAARDLSYSEIVTQLATRDNHPPLYYFIIKASIELFGISDISVRVPGVVLGVLAVYLTYALAKMIDDKKSLWASFIVAISPIMIYYSQEARMYMLTVAAVLFLAISALKVIRDDKTSNFILLSFSILIALLSDYITVFAIFAAVVYLAIVKRNYHFYAKIALSFIPTLVFLAIWSPILLQQIGGYEWLSRTFGQWFNIVGSTSLKEVFFLWSKILLGRISFDPDFLYLAYVAVFSTPVLLLMLKSYVKSVDSSKLLIWIILTLPPVVSFTTSFLVPTFSYFRFTYIFPFLVLAILFGVKSFGRDKLFWMFIVGLILGTTITYFSPSSQRENWKGAAEYIKREANPKSVVLHEFPEPFAPWRWYGAPIDSFGATDALSATEATYDKVREMIGEYDRIYYFEYLRDLTNPNGYTVSAIKDSGFVEVKALADFNGIGIIRIWER